MAGDFSIAATLNEADLDPLWNAGLEMDILVDLSHNANCETKSADGTTVAMKGIELDMAVKKGTSDAGKWTALVNDGTKAAAATEIVDWIEGEGGFTRLERSNVKVEVPNFAADVFDPANAYGDAANAVAACTEAAATFDALPDYQRKAFGMYKASDMTLNGSPESGARTKA